MIHDIQGYKMSAAMYMYDVRGIQNYIFRTNKIKEIIGASHLVEDEIIKVFKQSSNDYKVETNYSAKSELKFFSDASIDAEIFYYGGGNLLVLYKDEEIGNEVSKKMRIKLVKDSYSLQLAVAHVLITDKGNYKSDYKLLREEMEITKVNMPMNQPIGGFPMTSNDPVTGFPFSKEYKGQRVTYETYTKLKSYERIQGKEDFDLDFGGKEGEKLIAVVHIDGNNMGNKIKETMENVNDYEEAAKKMRAMSEDIQCLFKDHALKRVHQKLKERYKKVPFRTIISAGDDITFICNANIALSCVKLFMETLLEQGDYKACAGIYLTHLNFPFSRAYEYAEQLCSNAKKYSRLEDGCYIDFQLNYSGMINDIDIVRNRQYVDVHGKSLIERPYYIGSDKGKRKNVNDLITEIRKISDNEVARSKMKGLREEFYNGEQFVMREIERIDSRLGDNALHIEADELGILFDAVDVMDLKWGDDSDE